VSLDLVNQHATRMRPIAICGVSGCTDFFHNISKRHNIRTKVVEHKTYV